MQNIKLMSPGTIQFTSEKIFLDNFHIIVPIPLVEGICKKQAFLQMSLHVGIFSIDKTKLKFHLLPMQNQELLVKLGLFNFKQE